jgi:4-aminobutyrate aminotransferase-like enzyme
VNTSNRDLARRLRRVESRNITYYSKTSPIFWASAKGARVRDVGGRRYIDLTSAFGVASLGHGAAAVERALHRQSRRLWHGMGDVHPTAAKVELLERLARVAPGNLGVTILASSGAEAVEAALKTARLATGKPGLIVFDGAYHGLSYGTLGLTDRPEFSVPFQDQMTAIAVRMPFPDPLRGPTEEECLEKLEKHLKDIRDMGAILVEPVQGRGGIRVASPLFLRSLRDLTRRFGLLLIADEIMTGFGRTGRMFAVDHAGVVPDLLCVGKALANGFPLSACIGTRAVMKAWPPSDGEAIHTSTFLGNPLGCAMASAAIQELEKRGLASRAAPLGRWWRGELESALGGHPRVGDIRGIGLMIGIEIVRDKKSLVPDRPWTQRVVNRTLQQGVIALSGGRSRNVLTLTPPLTISQDELGRATRILRAAFYG